MSNNMLKNPTWNLTTLLKSENSDLIEKYLLELKGANKAFVDKWKNNKKYLEDAVVLKEALDDYEKLNSEYGTIGKVGYYFWLKNKQNQLDSDIKSWVNKSEELATQLANNINFFTHRLSKISLSKQKEFLDSSCLSAYKHFLEQLFKISKYLLSEDEEKILKLTSKTSFSNWVDMVNALISKEEYRMIDEIGKKKTKTFNELLHFLNSKNKEVRDNAAKGVNKILLKYADVAEYELNSILETKKVLDNLRNFERPDQERHLSDDIDTSVVDALVESVTSRFDISKRYYALKAKLLNQEKLAYHERNIEYGSFDKKYSYEYSLELIEKVFKNLDPQFYDIFKKYIEEERVDVYPRKGKSGGAFCTYLLKDFPDYILLNHNGALRDVTTFAHELGHGINNVLMRKQNALNYDTPLAIAEVSSTFFEDFVLDELAKDADDDMKLSIMMLRLNDAVSTIHRQIACYTFEQELHKTFREKGYLSKKTIGDIFKKHMSAYMGDYVEQSKGSENWWIYWDHIRRFFYVYSYASGLLISKTLQNMIKQDPKSITKVKEFLSAGSSKSPKDIFVDLNIDITDTAFWDKGLDEIDALLTQTESLAKKLKRI